MLTDADRDRFLALIERMDATYSKPEDLKRARSFWQALRFYTITEISNALDAHISDQAEGRFYPTPAHLITRIPSANKRPSAAEAWATALQSFDERASVLLNDEIIQARNAALPIFDSGDKIGARFAFVAAYERAVRVREASNADPQWFPSLGHDGGAREDVIAAAQALGLISAPQAKHLLPSSQDGGVIGGMLAALPNLTSKELKPEHPAADEDTRRRLRAIIDGVKKRDERERQERHQQLTAKRNQFSARRDAATKAVELMENGETAAAREVVARLSAEAHP